MKQKDETRHCKKLLKNGVLLIFEIILNQNKHCNKSHQCSIVSTSFWVCAAPKSWSKYTTLLDDSESMLLQKLKKSMKRNALLSACLFCLIVLSNFQFENYFLQTLKFMICIIILIDYFQFLILIIWKCKQTNFVYLWLIISNLTFKTLYSFFITEYRQSMTIICKEKLLNYSYDISRKKTIVCGGLTKE